MSRSNNNHSEPEKNSSGTQGQERTPRASDDIHDSPRDIERLKPDETTIELPDVKDIPGQEYIHVPRLGELADTTISSDDEEGVGLFNDDEDDETLISMGTENDVSPTDKNVLANMDHLQGADDDMGVQRATLDNVDFEGDELNEKVDVAGADLDDAGVEEDDAMENIGEEDEENNQWSRGSDRNDGMNEGTP